MTPSKPLLHQAAQAVASAEAMLIGAGAGMGVDSGLPDFRGPQGFWREYPPYQQLGLHFEDLANPRWFLADPALAWGFYGHRRNLYRKTKPHAGFDILRSWAKRMKHGAFVYTSNVDGQFQRAGFAEERVVEVHGALDWMQCLKACGIGVFPADAQEIVIDEATMRAREPFPSCPRCGELARPNILMFGDWNWDLSRTRAQDARLEEWLRELGGARVVVIEGGAGTAIPTVRHYCEELAGAGGAVLIRINLRESVVPAGGLGLAMEALAALTAINERLADV